jgi:HEPN domain-containing protein
MTNNDASQLWLSSAEEAYVTAEDSFVRHPNWAFFFWHLAIEKLLKGLIILHGKDVLPVHDLVKLALLSGTAVTAKQKDQLAEITSYAISARYDDIKKSYYKKVTDDTYKTMWSQTCREIYLWLKNQY